MKKYFLLIIAIFTISIANAQWQQINNFNGGYANALTIKGTSVFVGIETGGVFKSNDNGTSWNAVNNGLSNHWIYSLVSNDSILFAATNGGLHRSIDNGQNWTYAGNGINTSNVSCVAINGTHIFAGSTDNFQNGVFVSTDYGLSWQPMNNGLTNKIISNLFCN